MASTATQTAPQREQQSETIRLRGVRVHNLQDLDLDIPRDRLVVITGPSGSGKSSLAFDTIFAEGQRQYIETLSTYVRHYMPQMERPDVDLIEGLEPTIAIDQRPGGHNPRSTVGTVTEIYDHLRLLMARLGEVQCYQCGAPIRQQSPDDVLHALLELPEGTKAMLLAPLVRGRKGEHKEALAGIRKAGFVRARVDGQVYELDQVPPLVRQRKHHVEAVVDRVVIRKRSATRIADSLQLALKHGEGVVIVHYQDPADSAGKSWRDELFNTLYACPRCRISYDELEPRTFSFSSPYGACPECDGLGYREAFDPDLVVPDHGKSLAAGAVAPWREASKAAEERHRKAMAPYAAASGFRWNTPLQKLRWEALEGLLHGAGDFPGVLGLLERDYHGTSSAKRREKLEAFRGEVPCAACGGARLRPEARSVRLGGSAIHEITALCVDAAAAFFAGLKFRGQRQELAGRIVPEICARLAFLQQVGLGYLTLDRRAATLSGGELQRVKLATGIGSALVGVCYVLDEPSVGLHPRDNARLIAALRALQRLGNSVLVVEHDETIMRAADELIDLGPGAGRHGGRLIAQGTVDEVCGNAESLTGRYLAGESVIEVPASRRTTSPRKAITIEGASANNLQRVTARFPLSALVCVTGVSGSGKSSLLNETLARAVARKLNGGGPKPGPFTRLRGASKIDKLIQIDQSPIGRTPRSNAATYTGVFDEIRKVFSTTRESRLRGYKVGRFSFNVKGGRCEECQGQGLKRIEMNFLPDLYVTCQTCGGRRFNRQTLEVRYRGHSIADVLDLRADEALPFFENHPAIRRGLESLHEVGLGYLTLGQPSTTLSGGEAQRVKLATELARVATGNTLYVLDEPTTGLHFEDVRNLLGVLDRLVDRGNTVIVIEHHLDVIKRADWIIDLGPDGGAAGGRIVAEGTPEDVAAVPGNHTAACLRAVLPPGGG